MKFLSTKFHSSNPSNASTDNNDSIGFPCNVCSLLLFCLSLQMAHLPEGVHPLLSTSFHVATHPQFCALLNFSALYQFAEYIPNYEIQVTISNCARYKDSYINFRWMLLISVHCSDLNEVSWLDNDYHL